MSLQLRISSLHSDRCCVDSDATDSTADATERSETPSEQVSEILSQSALTLELPRNSGWNSPCSTSCCTGSSRGSTCLVTVRGSGDVVKAVRDGFEQAFRNEVAVYERLPAHPNIATYRGSENAGWAGLIFLKQYDQDLKQFIVESVKINALKSRAERQPEALVKKSMFEVFKGLAYLENHSIVHGDIKPQNILVGLESGELVIADFGSAVVLADGEESASGLPFGTRRYLPPESREAPYIASFQSDAWSAGFMMFELLLSFVDAPNKTATMADPFREADPTVTAAAADGRRWPIELEEAFPFMNVSEDCQDLLRGLLRFDRTTRLRSSEALSHKWFAEEAATSDH